MTFTSSSAAARLQAASRASSSAMFCALATSGRLRVMIPTRSSTSYRISSMRFVLCRLCRLCRMTALADIGSGVGQLWGTTASARQAEDALGDDVPLDLGGAAGDGPAEAARVPLEPTGVERLQVHMGVRPRLHRMQQRLGAVV